MHDLPSGFHKEFMAMQIGNFLGKFLECDKKNLSNGYRNFMRIQVQIDVRKPLKKKSCWLVWLLLMQILNMRN